MMFRKMGAVLAGIFAICAATPASAYLYWVQPNFAGTVSNGDEPGLGIAMPKATKAELRANMLWNVRAGLNVAALQCQFSPILMTVPNYNDLLRKNDAELDAAQKALNGYFKRTAGKGAANAFDRYTTRVYNGFSTMHAQLGFCETASSIGRDARKLGPGKLTQLAAERIREFRNSLVPTGDMMFVRRVVYIPLAVPPLGDDCWNRSGLLKARCVAASPARAEAGTDSRSS
jgi:hypothetical protein